jgi:hypothetical protein
MLSAGGGFPDAQMEYGPIKPEQCEAYRAQKEKTRHEEITRFQAAMAANKSELAALVQQHGLQHVDPSGARAALQRQPLCDGVMLFSNHWPVVTFSPRSIFWQDCKSSGLSSAKMSQAAAAISV